MRFIVKISSFGKFRQTDLELVLPSDYRYVVICSYNICSII